MAKVTQRFPGPLITSTRGIDSVPQARAAIAWAPPIRYTSRTPARWAAASTIGLGSPPGPGGVTITRRSTPATRAGTAFISTVLG